MSSLLQALIRIGAVCRKEVLHLIHDRLTFGMVVMIPLFQLVLFGYTINTDVRQVPAGLVDQPANSFSRQLALDLEATQVLHFIARCATPQELEGRIRDGELSAGLVIPPDAEERYQLGDRPTAQLVVDGSDTMVAGALRQLANFRFAPGRTLSNRDTPQAISVRLLYNPERRAALFTVPGLLGVILTMTMIMFTSIAIVRERERGNMELLIATPIRNLELMIGKIIPYIGIGLLQVSVILFLGVLLFAIPVAGKLLEIYTVCLIFILANLTLGLMISTLARNQLAAMQMFIFVFLPSMLLSGFMFPFVAMPRVARQLAEVLPLTHFLRIIRGIILRGEPLTGMGADIGYLLGFATLFLAISAFRFSKRLE
ncbi:ABC transporter permease [Desulfogranum mediterraneum]|uniref:ABC transporter permease n=1 Tax=Desulfogranum mediterraneum TaxID=160661 RepID=UPI0004081E6D|nr:ABC transporter permease [Desulfogranum mediterraneum]